LQNIPFPKKSVTDISEAVWSWRDGVCQDFLIEKAKKHPKSNVFSPLRICCAMDSISGMLNFQSLRVLHGIESDANQERVIFLFPSPTILSQFIANFTGFC
jgi:hypothetical protein